MGLLAAEVGAKPVHLTLSRDRVRALKSGSPWVYADSLRELPSARPGALALIKTKDGDIIAKGMYDPGSAIAFRAVAVKERRLDDGLVAARLERAVSLRERLFEGAATDGYRLVNGEGDGLPGLVCDLYASTAVLKLDGAGPSGFYDTKGVAQWLTARLPRLTCVWLKHRAGEDSRGAPLLGPQPKAPVEFVENGVRFAADVVMGQKTGFFLDQRDNRRRMQALYRGRRVLNLFAYTGGFSAYAGAAGAAHVTSVDLAAPACAAADANWALNGLPAGGHAAVAADCFQFLEDAAAAREAWDVVIVDPPSFAPSKQSVPKATGSYERLFAKAAQVTAPGGILALSSCSSHIDFPLFHQICEGAVGRARRCASVLGVYGQPEDHPFPAACPELRYLKFVTHGLD
ncbi:MAG: S-adenosyl-L-methionine-dependent methyltransferase [Monoraphidium minutum]|nr:MAG: S-adenosyl-L-methionine-dependent methyltransferase [Monoraphidium minutum]